MRVSILQARNADRFMKIGVVRGWELKVVIGIIG
jgi:hypothetical protein